MDELASNYGWYILHCDMYLLSEEVTPAVAEGARAAPQRAPGIKVGVQTNMTPRRNEDTRRRPRRTRTRGRIEIIRRQRIVSWGASTSGATRVRGDEDRADVSGLQLAFGTLETNTTAAEMTTTVTKERKSTFAKYSRCIDVV